MSTITEAEKGLLRVPKLVPDQQRAYQQFSKSIWSKGALSSKQKETIAVGVAHSTKCNYCIQLHTKKAKRAGATLEELAEAVMITAALEAQGSIITGNQVVEKEGMEELVSDKYNAALHFLHSVFEEGQIERKLKYLIAIAVAHTAESPDQIAIYSKEALKHGATEAEIAESILISALMRAGGTITYISNVIQAYEAD